MQSNHSIVLLWPFTDWTDHQHIEFQWKSFTILDSHFRTDLVADGIHSVKFYIRIHIRIHIFTAERKKIAKINFNWFVGGESFFYKFLCQSVFMIFGLKKKTWFDDLPRKYINYHETLLWCANDYPKEKPNFGARIPITKYPPFWYCFRCVIDSI